MGNNCTFCQMTIMNISTKLLLQVTKGRDPFLKSMDHFLMPPGETMV